MVVYSSSGLYGSMRNCCRAGVSKEKMDGGERARTEKFSIFSTPRTSSVRSGHLMMWNWRGLRE